MGNFFSENVTDFNQRIYYIVIKIATQFYSPDQVRMMAGKKSGWNLFAPKIPIVSNKINLIGCTNKS